MPVIVVGADTKQGLELLDALYQPPREVRAFVSDEDVAHSLRERGFKVAFGDVSDDSHIEAAASDCFSAVLVTEAAHDDRERAFAEAPEQVLAGWARAVAAARVRRVIWLGEEYRVDRVSEVTRVDPRRKGAVRRVVELDDAQTI